MKLLNVLALVLFILVSIPIFLLERGQPYQVNQNMMILFIFMFLWLILHELLHGLGFLLAKNVKIKNLTLGIALEKGVFYCMCKQKIGKKDILISLLFPLTIIGIITLIIGMIWNQYELVFLSILNITSSIGDIMMAIYFVKAPNDIIYLDLDDCTSFTVISKSSLESIRVPSIILNSQGLYDEKTMYAKDQRRIIISKPSYILIVFIFILILINIVGGIL